MKTKTVLFLLCVVGIGGFLLSCSPVQSYPEQPEIHFKKLVFENRFDTLSREFVNTPVLTFSFIDGDGDLGVRPQDIASGGVSRIHYTWIQKKSDGTYEPFKFPSDSINHSSAIPYRDVMDKSDAQNKTLKGTMEIALARIINTQGLDTMRVEFYIVDRARNKSEKVNTPDFSILSPVGTEITQ